ncbi:MAG: glycosyltransferase, partial [Nanoarchaeales archaeon]|nr:glycosyltransferase [Nanoarchaeales archaeon]
SKFDLIQKYGELVKSKICVIPNSFNLNNFDINLDVNLTKQILFKKYNIPLSNLDKNVLLNVGSDETRKNLTILLTSLSNLDDYIFIKIGKPQVVDNRVKNLKLIKKLNLNVFFLEGLTDTEVIEFYKISNLFVMPSLKEGFGRPIIESQASELPVLASDINIFREICGDSVMYIKNFKSSSDWFNCITVFFQNNDNNNFKLLGLNNSKKYDVNLNYKLFMNLLLK